jgi:hypothetical protein
MDDGEDSEYDSGSDQGSFLSVTSDVLAQPTPGHHPTVDDFLAVQALFLRFLPLELAYSIMNVAEYWPRIETSRANVLQVSAHLSNGLSNNASWCYFITSSIPEREGPGEGAEFHAKVQRVRFWTLSHDQGWSDVAEDQGRES